MAMRFPSSAKLAASKRVGTGGGGEVWSATHEILGPVAVKIAHENTEEFRHSFTTEYTLLRSLKHSAVISLFDFGCLEDGRPYIVMELCEGSDLYQTCDTLPLDRRLCLFAQVLTGFEYLHNVGLIHRDIKGENILVAQDNTPRISDLGLAILSGSTDRERSGTLEYMSPEVLQNEGASAASDIYALGVTLYRLVTGKLPFSGTDPLKVIAAKQDLESVEWDGIEEAISSRTAEFIRKSLHPNPEERPSSARAFIDHLLGERLVNSSLIAAPDICNYVHYHYRSFNYSFCKQELGDLTGDLYLNDRLQDPESGLFDAVTDYLKTQFYHISADGSARKITYEQREGRTRGTIQFQQALTHGAPSAKCIDYPELSSDSLFNLSEKILRRKPLSRYQALIHEHSSGNLALLSLLLRSLQEQGYLDAQVLRLGLPAEEIDQFSPDQEYWQKLSTLVPWIDHNLVPVAAFLSCDNSDYPFKRVVESQLVDKSDMDYLVEARILNQDNLRFTRTYMRLHYYHSLDQNERRQYHAEWIAHLKTVSELDDITRESFLFGHYVAARVADNAVSTGMKLAEHLSARQDFEEAYDILSRVRLLAQNSESTALSLGYMIDLAGAAKKLGKIDESLNLLSAVIRHASRQHDAPILAEAYKRAGDLYKDKRQFQRGLRSLDKAIRFYEEIGNELELSHCFNNLGNLHWIAGDLAAAESDYGRALGIQRKLNVRRDIASTLSNLGTVLAVQQKLEPAIEMYEESIAIKRELNDRLELARTLNNLARARLEADQMADARSHVEEALEINLDLGAESELPYNYDNLFELEYRDGNYDRALDWLMTGLRRSNQKDVTSRATFICYLSEIMLVTGRYGKAAKYLTTAAQLAQQVTDHLLNARLSVNFCEYFRTQRDFESAHAWTEKAMEDAKKFGDPKAMAQVLVKSAKIELAEGTATEKIESTLLEAARLISGMPARRELIMIQLTQAQWHLEGDKLEQATQILAELESMRSMEIFKPFEPEYLYCRAWLGFAKGDMLTAAQEAQEAIEVAEQLSTLELRWQALLIAGEAYRELRQYENAMNAYIGAFETIQRLTDGIEDTRLKEMFLRDDTKLVVADRLNEMGELVS